MIVLGRNRLQPAAEMTAGFGRKHIAVLPAHSRSCALVRSKNSWYSALANAAKSRQQIKVHIA